MDEIKATLQPWLKLPGYVGHWTIDSFTRYELSCRNGKVVMHLKSPLTGIGPKDVLAGEVDDENNLIDLRIGRYTRDIDEKWLLKVVQEIVGRDNKH